MIGKSRKQKYWLGITCYLLFGVGVSCQQNIHPQKEKITASKTALKRIESIQDSTIIGGDSSLLNRAPKAVFPYAEVFAPNTAMQTKITVYKMRLDTANIALFNGNYRSINQIQQTYPRKYNMMTNAGMFHPNGAPVGLFSSNGNQINGINLDSGKGNFFLQPNGVFYVTKDKQAGVLETKTFLDSIYNKEIALDIATQSGPMLIINGQYHPKFNENSSSKRIRSGVGVTETQELIFILSEEVVNFYTFATIFLKKGCKNALYLDGTISSMYLAGRGDDFQRFNNSYGPMLGVYNPTDSLAVSSQVIPLVDSINSEKIDTTIEEALIMPKDSL